MSLQIKNVCKSLGHPPQEIIKNVSFEVTPGEFVSLRGRSGSGKSTLLYLLSTLDVPTLGDIIFYGQNVKGLSSKELRILRNQKLGFIFQFHYLLPELSALNNVLMPARKMGLHKEKEDYAKYLLEIFDLKDHFNHRPGELSGGQSQRVAVARALIMKPNYLFADEPTGSLDSINSEKVFDIFQRINKEMGTTIVMVTHDEEFSKRAQRVIELVDGRVIRDSAGPN